LPGPRGELALAGLNELHPPAAAPDTETEHPKTEWALADLEVERLLLRHGVSAPVSFVVPAGELVAIVGPTGEGKTTLLRTLLGLEPARGGVVRYDGVPLPAGPGFAYRPFAWVPQDAALLNDTLAANVWLGKGDAPDDPATLRTLLARLGGTALLVSTEGKKLGPGGLVASGGERQRIALARALATSQPVLIVDEPTSGLDGASQASVLDAIAELRGKRSVVFVTHRPEPLALAHTIVRFDGTEVRVEAGALRGRGP
jgi:ABC-type transport system involved in cytochrome bd biosynthesis fused ATPase/permease subunit